MPLTRTRFPNTVRRSCCSHKEKLEQSEDKQAKEVLVDVYDLFPTDGTATIGTVGGLRKELEKLNQLVW